MAGRGRTVAWEDAIERLERRGEEWVEKTN
jgi:hypothetical protein